MIAYKLDKLERPKIGQILEISLLKEKVKKLKLNYKIKEKQFKIDKLNYLFRINEQNKIIDKLEKQIKLNYLNQLPDTSLNEIKCFPDYEIINKKTKKNFFHFYIFYLNNLIYLKYYYL